jgi:uncharacterized membrane protein
MIYKKISLLMAAIGLWLIAAPWTFGYQETAMAENDYWVGGFFVSIGVLSYVKWKDYFSVIFMALGFWLGLSPLLFWAELPVSYVNATLVGIIVVVFCFRMPAMQGKHEEVNAGVPQGWSFNPSAWTPRIVTVFLAMLCWFVARYLAAYQLGYITSIWDPFFGESTIKVLNSKIAKFFPISDAGLGAFCYSIEAVLGFQGNQQRWRTMPWVVLVFGFMVVPAGLVSIALIVLQPIVVKAWCGLCLVIGGCMLIMVLLTVTEVVATIQFLVRYKDYNRSFWNVFFKGASSFKNKTKPKDTMGITLTWRLILCAILGMWTIAAPEILASRDFASLSNYITGPLIVAVSIISFAEVARVFRFFNIILSLWLLTAPWVIGGASLNLLLNDSFVAIAIIFLSLSKGRVKHKYGSLSKFII